MHIEFKRVILHNFMSFGDADLRFNDEGFVRVIGVNENPLDNAGSNGSGKSSLWEAIVWCITGETIRGTKQVVNLYGEDGCFVDIEFYIDNTRYQLIRSKDHKVYKTNLQIFIDGQDVSGKGIRDSQQLLQQYLPDITSSLLGSVIILGQGLPQKFTNNTPSGRKEVLEKLSKSDFMIEDLKNRTADRKTTLTHEQREFEDKIIELSAQKNFLLTQIAKSQDVLATLDATKMFQEREAANADKTSIENDLSQLQPQQQALREQLIVFKEKDASIIAEQTNDLSEAKLSYENTVNPVLTRLSELRAELSVYRNELTRIQNIQDVCPTCGQKITGVHKPDTTDIEQKIEKTTEMINEFTSVMEKHKADYESTIRVIQDKYRKKRSCLLQDSKNLSDEQQVITSRVTTLERNLSDITSTLSELDKQLAQLQTNIEFNEKIISDNTEKLTIIEDDLLYNNMQRDLTKSHLEVISKFDTALKRDFRGYLLSTVIDYIETRAKQYCKVIFDTTDIRFCLDGNNIDISYMNKAYENLSGGEKQKIDLIIQFSIRDMLSSHLNFTSNILVLDEVFDGLDTTGCNRVIDMISNLSDVKNVFIVTHRKDLSIPSDKELVVVKSSAGITEMRY